MNGYSLRGQVTSSHLFNEIMMLHANANAGGDVAGQRGARGVILLVEGDTDKRLFARFTVSSCQVIACDGKRSVLDNMKRIRELGKQGVIAIIDRDYDELLGRLESDKHVFYTDTTDMETLMLKTGDFRDLLSEYGDSNLIERVQRQASESMVEWLVKALTQVGILRYLSAKLGWNLNFREIAWERLFDEQSLAFEQAACIGQLLAGNERLARSEVERLVAVEQTQGHSPWTLVNGHDVMKFFACHFVRSSRLTAQELQSGLRLSYQLAQFAKTELYRELTAWETESGYRDRLIDRAKLPGGVVA